MTCVKCGAPVSKPGTGRPPKYCSTGCRRAVEFELRRLQRHLVEAEERLRRHRERAEEIESAMSVGHGTRTLERERFEAGLVSRHIAELEERLRVLLDPEAE